MGIDGMKILLKNDCPIAEAYLRHSDLLEKSNKYDCIITSRHINDRVISEYKNILLVEKLDCASIWCRKYIKHPHVKTLLKMYYYEELHEHNRPCVDGRLFVDDVENEKEYDLKLTEEDFSKVKTGLSFFHYKHFEYILDVVGASELKSIEERPIYSFFAGTTDYDKETASGKWVSKHRLECVELLKKLKDRGYNVIFSEHKTYTPKDYYLNMLNTKFIYSPFGWGEFCYRDYEAILCGCCLFKPSMPHKIVHTPDISQAFNFGFGENCRPDLEFSKWLCKEKKNERSIIERILE